MAVSPDASHLEIESWTLFGAAWIFILARMYRAFHPIATPVAVLTTEQGIKAFIAPIVASFTHR